jgi:spore germination protein GerM
LNGGTAIVDLSRPFTALSGSDQLLALAQIVFTLTSRPGIGQVQFTLGGAAIDIPRANGSLTPSPVSRDDYGPLSPP